MSVKSGCYRGPTPGRQACLCLCWVVRFALTIYPYSLGHFVFHDLLFLALFLGAGLILAASTV
jgi:hypothetical protein